MNINTAALNGKLSDAANYKFASRFQDNMKHEYAFK